MIKYKNVMLLLGKLLGWLGLAYVIFSLSNEFTLNNYIENLLDFKSVIPFLIVLNLCSYFFGVHVWHSILKVYSQKIITYRFSFYHFAKTEIAKYLPGNVFHIVGRQMLSSKFSISQKEMFKSTIFYSLLIVSATWIIITVIIYLTNVTSMTGIAILSLSTSAIILGNLFIFPLIRKIIKLKLMLFLVLALIFQSTILAIIISKQIPLLDINSILIIISIYLTSWIVGFITPGASGGLGVREGVFLGLMPYVNVNLNIPTHTIVFSIVLIRLINIFTDIIAFLFTCLQKNND